MVTDAQPTPTAAEVLAAHYGSWSCPTCGPETSPGSVVRHQADMLAAAGLLVTPEHDAQVLREALPDREDLAYLVLAATMPFRGAGGQTVPFVMPVHYGIADAVLAHIAGSASLEGKKE